MPQPKLQFLLCLLAYTVVVRLMPYVLMNCDIKADPSVLYYPWNFSPLAAACLFGGAFLADRRMSFLIPLATLFVSDLGIAALTGHLDWAFPTNSWVFTYVSFAGAAALGFVLRNGNSRHLVGRAVALGLSFEVLFFAVSNFVVWLNVEQLTPVLYPHTAAGLIECYWAALPFVGKSLLGTAAFTALLFSPLGVRAATDVEPEPNHGPLARVRVK